MYAAATQNADRVLSKLAQANAVTRDIRMFLNQTNDIAHGRIAVHTEQQIGTAQVKEAEGMTLDYLCPVHDPTQFGGGRRDVNAKDCVASFGGGKKMADGAYAADAGGDARHFPEASAFTEFLEATEFSYMEARVLYLTIIIEHDSDLGVPFNTCDGIDCYRLRHCRLHLWVYRCGVQAGWPLLAGESAEHPHFGFEFERLAFD